MLRIPFFCLLAVAALAPLPIHAATVTWDGTTDMTWTQPDSTSWNATYNSGDTAQFLGAGAGNVTITGGGVTPGAVIVNSTANYTFTGGAIGNNGTTTLTKSGTGVLTLSNANTYTGQTTVNGSGILDVGTISSNAISNSSYILLGATDGSSFGILQGNGNFTRTIASNPSWTPSAGAINSRDGGFAARGGTLTVNFGGAGAEIGMIASGGVFGSNFRFGTASADSKVIVQNAINLGGTSGRTFTVTAGIGGDAATSAELSGVISNPGGITAGASQITKEGNGMLILSNAGNSFNGPVWINAGSLSVSKLNSVGGGNSTLGAPTSSTNGTIGFGSASTTGRLLYTGTGDTTDRIIQLRGTTGGATLDQSGTGLLKFTSNLTISTNGTKTLTLQGSTAGTGEFAGNIVNSANGTTSLTKNGTGTWRLSGNNTYTGLTTVSGGVLDIGAISSNAISNSSGIFLSGGGILQGSGTFTRSSSASATPGADQYGSADGGFAARGGQLTVTFSNNSSTELSMNGGAFRFGNNFAFGSTSADNKVVVTNNIDLNSTNGARVFTVTAGVGGAAATSAELSGVIRNTAAGTGQLTKRGDGMLILSNTANSWNGPTVIEAGAISIASIKNVGGGNSSLGAANSSANGTITMGLLGGATLRYTGTGDTTDRPIALAATNNSATLDQSGTGLLKFTSNMTIGAGTKTLALQGSTAGTGEISGNIPNPSLGNLAVTKTGTGTWTLSGSNTYAGQTNVTDGVLDVGVIGAGGLSANSGLFLGESATGATSGILQGSGTFTRSLSENATPTSTQMAAKSGGFAARGGDLTVNLGGAGAQISLNGGLYKFGTNFIFGSSTADSKVIVVNPINLGAGNGTQRVMTVNAGVGGAAATSAELQGVISDSSGVTNGIYKKGNGTLILTGSNTYTFTTGIEAGTLQIGNGGGNGSIDPTGAVGINSSGTLAFNRTGSLSIGNAISGGGGVSQIGSGTTTLSNTNTYNGATTVSAGTLLINGSTAADSAVSVNSGGTLGGTGTVGGSITVNSGGTLSPGSSIESLASGSNTWNGGGALTFEFSTNGSTGAAGTEWDLLSITGGLNLSGASSGTPFTLNLVTMANATTPGFLATWNPNVSATWAGFVTTTTGVSSFSSDKFAFNIAGFQNGLNGSFSVTLNSNNLDLVYTAVPEPSTWALLAFSLTTVMALRRRRRS